MLRKIFVIGLVALNFGFLTPALAEDTTANLTVAKEFNPLCWQRKECEAKRTELNGNKPPAGKGFIDTSEAGICAVKGATEEEDWGRCLPSNVAVTEIAFGGKREFSDMGAFLTNGYKLALSIASILAAIMIVVAGFQWTASGGNASIITSAKSRIAGAIIGLFIAYTSYFILYTINPNLVNLHLPQAWLLRPQALMPKFCNAIPMPTDPTVRMFHLVFTNTDQTSVVPTEKSVNYEMSYADVFLGLIASSTKGDGEGGTVGKNCGYRFLSKESGNFACFGDGCPENNICANININQTSDTSYHCVAASVVGTVVGSYLIPPICGLKSGYKYGTISGVLSGSIVASIVGSIQSNSWLSTGDTLVSTVSNGDTGIYRVCKVNGGNIGLEEIVTGGDRSEDEQKRITYFAIKSISSDGLSEVCSSGGEFVGYGVGLQLNANCWLSQSHLVDRNGEEVGFFGDVVSARGTVFDENGMERESSETMLGIPKPVGNITKDRFFSRDEILAGQRINVDVANLLQEK